MTPKVTFSTNPNTTSAENKRMLALYNSSQLSQGMTEFNDAYYKRMEQWKEELAARIKEDNTNILQSKLNGIDTKIGTDLYSLTNTNKNIDSLRLWEFWLGFRDPSINSELKSVLSKQTLIQNQIAIIQKEGDKKDKLDIRDGLGLKSASEEEALLTNLASSPSSVGMFDNDVLKKGSRNIVS